MNLVEVLKESCIFKHTHFFLDFSALLTVFSTSDPHDFRWEICSHLNLWSPICNIILFFCGCVQNILSSLVLSSLITMCLDTVFLFLIYLVWDFLIFLSLYIDVFTKFEKFWLLFLQICFSAPIFFSRITQILFILSQRSLNNCFILIVFSFLYFLFVCWEL